jgi:hypothetical protein
MFMRLILLPLLFLAFAASADIYRWTDAEGNVVFGDNPPEGVQAERIQLRQPMTTPAMPQARDILERGRETANGIPASPYERLRIASPGDDEPVRANDGNFTITVDINPELRTQAGHRLRLILDGSPVGTSDRPSFEMRNIDRGTHRIQVQVLDRDEQVIQESGTVQFHLLRHHI